MAPRVAVSAAVAAVLVIGVRGVVPFNGTSTLGQCAVDEEELAMAGPRKPTANVRYISYAALQADQIPCNRRGQSYYSNCGIMKQANPYTRGCSAITRCARNMK